MPQKPIRYVFVSDLLLKANNPYSHITDLSPSGSGGMWLAWFLKRTQPPLIPAAATQPGLPTESGAWRTVAKAGSRSHSGQLAARLAMSQVPRPHPHPHSKPRISWWWGRGLVSAWGLTGYRGAVLLAHNSCCLPRARLKPPSSPADEDNLCACWKEVAARGPVHNKPPEVL